MAQDVTQRLAARLSELRRARGLTLDQLATVSGVSRAALSRLENAEVSPSLDVLTRLAAAHDMSLSRLAALAEDGFAAHIPRDEQAVQKGEGRSVVRRIVSPGTAALSAEVVELRFPAGKDWTEQEGAVPGQERHIVVLQGEVIVSAAAGPHTLETGDCLRLRMDDVLHIGTREGQGAKILIVCVAA